MTHERLDEAIDRVARDLTAAPADPALVTRITARVEGARSQRFEWWRITLPAMGVAAVALFAFVMLPGDRTSPAPSPVATAPDLVPPPSNLATPIAPVVELVARRASAPRPRRDPLPLFEPQIPQIEALSSPALLAVDGLTADQLTIVPVDVASLDLANLAFTDADRPADPKE